MALYNEQEVVEKIRELPRDVSSHIADLVTNGLVGILAVVRLHAGCKHCDVLKDIVKAVMDRTKELEENLKDLNLR